MSEQRAETLGDAFQRELERVRELLGMYQALPPQSAFFGAAILKDLIRRAEQAQSDNDVVAMIRLYQELRDAE